MQPSSSSKRPRQEGKTAATRSLTKTVPLPVVQEMYSFLGGGEARAVDKLTQTVRRKQWTRACRPGSVPEFSKQQGRLYCPTAPDWDPLPIPATQEFPCCPPTRLTDERDFQFLGRTILGPVSRKYTWQGTFYYVDAKRPGGGEHKETLPNETELREEQQELGAMVDNDDEDPETVESVIREKLWTPHSTKQQFQRLSVGKGAPTDARLIYERDATTGDLIAVWPVLPYERLRWLVSDPATSDAKVLAEVTAVWNQLDDQGSPLIVPEDIEWLAILAGLRKRPGLRESLLQLLQQRPD